MYLYRIVKDKTRTTDLTGAGAFRTGGRWNSKGTYMLYTSENSSLAYLENLVHFNDGLTPPHLHILQMQLDDTAPIYTLPDLDYPADWQQLELLENKLLGDKWMAELNFLGIKVKSAINTFEYNFLLNPLFPRYNDLVKLNALTEIEVDERLV